LHQREVPAEERVAADFDVLFDEALAGETTSAGDDDGAAS